MKNVLFGVWALSLTAQAKIYFDTEEDPLPLVQVSVVIPAGVYVGDKSETGPALLVPDILESGTMSQDKQAFLDGLAVFGASNNFTMGEVYSTWSLSFPYVEGTDYSGLAALLEDNWKNPRFTPEVFNLAKSKLIAALRGALDSDPTLAMIPSRRWSLEKFVGLQANTLERVQTFDLEKTKSSFFKNFVAVPNVWVGYIGPKKLQSEVEKIITRVFSQQGKVKSGQHWEVLKPAQEPQLKVGADSRAFIVNKKDRNQSVTRIFILSPDKIKGDDELSYFFGKHLLVGGGLGSIFWDEIRAKRGLSYNVSDEATYYFQNPSLGFATNPVRTRSTEALQVISELANKAYSTGEIFKEIPEDAWGRQWQSFKFSHLIDLSGAGGRLGHRLSVVTGMLSKELAQMPVEKWKVTRDEVQKLFPQLYKNSFKSVTVVGEAKELRPLIEKNFPGYSVQVINYENATSDKIWEEKNVKN